MGRHTRLYQKGRNKAITIRNRGKPVLAHGSGPGFVWIDVGTVTINSCYFSPNEDITDLENGPQQLGEVLTGSAKCSINVKSTEWAHLSDRRGEILSEWLSELALVVMNVGNTPTFFRGTSTSTLDLTIASAGCCARIHDWKVLENESLSLHCYIYFQYSSASHSISPASGRGWVLNLLGKDMPPVTWENVATVDVQPFIIQALLAAVDKLKPNRAPGPDNIPSEIVKLATLHFPEAILKVMNQALHTGKFREVWKRADLILLPKKNQPATCATDFRPISLLDAAGKLLEYMVLERLLEDVDRTISVRQFGFRRGMSTLDAIKHNLLYDGVLRLTLPNGISTIAYADALAIVVVARTEEELMSKANCAIEEIVDWLGERSLTIAPEMTDAVMLTPRTKMLPINFDVMGLLYAAPIWQSVLNNGKLTRRLESAGRKMALRVCSAYRTVSNAAVVVIADFPPIELQMLERCDRWSGIPRIQAGELLVQR
nr:unnamed protein product [Callosobruchus analis]